jgi:hypothetical protein
MKAIVFDSGPLITFALNSLLDVVSYLRKGYDGIFYISNAVHRELIDVPSKTKRFAFEAIRIKQLIGQNDIEIFDTEVYSQETSIIASLANSIYTIKGKPLKILNPGEIDALVLAKNINAEAVVVDERTTRLLIENPFRLKRMLEGKFRGNVNIDKGKLKEFEKHFSTLKIIRAVELALVAMDKGYFDSMMHYDDSREFVKALLWALKLNGCAINVGIFNCSF